MQPCESTDYIPLLQTGVWDQKAPPACGVGKGVHAQHLPIPGCCSLELLWMCLSLHRGVACVRLFAVS